MAEFFAMGGYAPYVWSSFGLTAVVLIVNVVAARRRLKKSLQDAGRRAARQRHRSAQV